MGGVSMSRMDNRSKYAVHHDTSRGHGKLLHSGWDNYFNDEHNAVTHDLRVYDGKSRLIKHLNFWSCKDNQWEIHNAGVRLVKRWDHSNGVGTGSYLTWGTDLEDHYNREDQKAEERRRQEEERRRQEEERRRQEEERRRKEEEERRRQEEERRRQEEERRRKEEEERQRQVNVDEQRKTEIDETRYHEDMEESTALNVEINRQLQERMMMREALEQQKTIGWSTADQVAIKGKMADINIQEEEDVSSADDEKRIRDFLRAFYSIDKQEDKHESTLNAIKQVKPTDLTKFPDKMILSMYRRVLELPEDKCPEDDEEFSAVLVELMIQLGVTNDPDAPLTSEAVIDLLRQLPTLPSSEDDEEIITAAVTQALKAFSEEPSSFPLNTFLIFLEKIFPYQNASEELLEILAGIIDSLSILISPKLADWVLDTPSGTNDKVISVILEKSEIKTEKMLKYLSSFPDSLPEEECIAHLCSYVDGDYSFEPELLSKFLQYLVDGSKTTLTQHLMLVVDAILHSQYEDSVEGQMAELENVVSVLLRSRSKEDIPLILKFAGGWYLHGKISFIEPLYNGMMNLLKEGAGEFVAIVSEFMEQVAEKDVAVLNCLVIKPDQLQMDRAGELELKTKLFIVEARLKAEIEVPDDLIQEILKSTNLSYDPISIQYALNILLRVVNSQADYPGENLLQYLDHVEAGIRIASFSVVTAMTESGQITPENIQPYIKTGKHAFQNWDSVENHEDATKFLKIVMSSISSEENKEEWDNLCESIINLCLPSVSSGNERIVRGSLDMFQSWIDRGLAEGLFEEDYLESFCENLHPRLLQKLLTHLLPAQGLSFYRFCLTKLAERVQEFGKWDEVELEDMAEFLKDEESESELKEELVMNVLAVQLEKCLPILSVIEHVVEFGNPEVVKVYAEAVSKLSAKHQLKEETMDKLFDILEDPRFKISIRKAVAKSLFYILRLKKEMLEESEKLQQALLKVLNNVNLRISGLFALCHVSALPESVRDEVLSILQNVHSQFAKLETVAVDELGQIDSEERLSFKLSEFLLGRFEHEEGDEAHDGRLCQSQFNWMTEWFALNKDDNLSYMFSDQGKHANWLLKQEDPLLLQQGHKLKVELGIGKADILLNSGKISEAEKALDKALKHGESPKLFLLKADVFMAKSSFRGALKLYRKAGNVNAETAFKMSRAYMALGEYDKALNLIPQNNPSQREICEKSQELFDMLHTRTGETSLSREQVKGFHAKTSRSFTPKEVVQMLQFMIEQEDHFDLSVIPAVSPHNWRAECLVREIFSRTINKTERSWTNFYYEFLQIQKVYRNSYLVSYLNQILELVRNEEDVDFSLVEELMFFLKIVRVHEDISVEKCLENAETLQELLRGLNHFWVQKKFSPEGMDTAESDQFLEARLKAKEQFSELSLTFLDVLLDLTKSSNKLSDVTDFLTFCGEESLPFPDLQQFVGELRLQPENVPVNLKEYQESFLKERLVKEILEMIKESGADEEDEKLHMVLVEMLSFYQDNIYSADETKEFVQFLLELESENRAEAIQNFLTALSVDKSYKNVTVKPKIFELVKGAGSGKEWKNELRSIFMGELLHTVDEDKDVDTLVSEYTSTNDAHFSNAFGDVSGFIASVGNAMQNSSVTGIHPDLPIESWDDSQFIEWAMYIRLAFESRAGAESSDLEMECFAVIQQAMRVFKGYALRQVGVMSLYILLSSKDSGCLAKIATGEGKSGLVAALAVIKCLQGHTVDVVTNSSVLAQRDCSEWEGFFSKFGLTAMENSGMQAEPHQAKMCYLANIVYGDTSAFQGDVLRHEFSLLGTRGPRAFDIVIVDEVDSMFIDGSNHSTRLIDKMPQMDYVEPLFAAIWNLVGAISSTIVGIEGKTYAISTDVCGYSNDLVGCVIKAVIAEKVALDKPCASDVALKDALHQFTSQMQEGELADSKFKKQVVQLLRQRNLWEEFPKQVGNELKAMELKELNENSSVVELYIREKWKLSDTVVLRNVLELYLKINILVFENTDNSLQLSKSFHADGDGEGNAKYPTMRFFKGAKDMFLLTFVENDTLYVARTVEKAVRKQFFSSYSYTPPPKGQEAKQSECKLAFPGHIYELFTTKVDEWINSAIQAMFAMEVNRNYVIKPGGHNGESNTITPVDFENTGVTQESSVWGEGLHQFLQMKHKLKISPEYLATNFISNMSFFRRYNSNIYGLTGTLGDANEVDLLKKLYGVETINVPTFKPKRLLELDSIVAYDEAQWKNEILNSAAWEIDAGRVVLIICRTIEDVNNLKTFLGEKLKEASGLEDEIDFRLYYRSDDASSEANIGGKMKNGTVVIATNLAGRGTNIKLSDDVIASGGLHVIITFLPTNVRVEEQAAGRAARNGEPGTFQLILNLGNEGSFIPLGREPTIAAMKEERAFVEKARVDKIRDKLARELVIEEKQFGKFCNVKQLIQMERPVEKNKPDFIMKGIGERWAVQLEIAKTRNDVVNWEKVDVDFTNFFENLLTEYKHNVAIQNPSYYVLQGNLHLLSDDDERAQAIEMYTNAINRDKVFVQHAFYNRAHAIINDADDDYKEKASKDLVEAANLINSQILPMLCSMHAMVDNKELAKTDPNKKDDDFNTFKAAKEDSDFTKQMVQKINFNYLQVKSINEALEKIQKSKRDVVAKFGDIKEFYAKNDTEIDYADIEEMEDNGFVRFMYVEEKPFPWWDVLAVFILGALQIVAGACLCFLGAVNIGSGLIAEGVSDFVTGITACITGEFSWTDYLKNKALSIGVSLLFAGAGVALKAVAALPKVASIVNTIKTSVIATKAVGAATAAWTAIKSAANYVWQGVKSGANSAWSAIKTGATSVYKTVMGSGVMKFVTNSKPWIYAKNALTKAYNVIKEGVTYVWNKAKDFHNKIFGTKNLDPTTYSNFKTVGQIVGREILNNALFAGLEHSVLEAIGNAIEERIREDVDAHMKNEVLGQNTETGKKCRQVLSSCMGKKFDVHIATEMRKQVEGEETPFGRTVYRTLISQTVTELYGVLMDDKKKAAKGWAALGMHLLDHLVSLVGRSVTIGETIKELHDAMPLATEQLEELLNSLEEKVGSHDHASDCNGASTPVDPRDMERIIGAHCSNWAATLAKRMRGLIMSNLVQPQVQVSYGAAFKIFTKGGEFNDFLEAKGKVNRTNMVAKRPKTAKIYNAFFMSFDEPNKSGGSNIPIPGGDIDPPPIPESDVNERPSIPVGDNDLPQPEPSEGPTKPKLPRGDSDLPEPEVDDILRFSSKQLDAAIDVYIETERGLKYKETIGSSENSDKIPLKIVSKMSEDGTQSFSRLTTSNSSNELQLMEFPIANEKASLYAAITCDSTVFETRKSFELKLQEFAVATMPRTLRSFSTIQ